jgi:RNA polymerase nonessential primary-like sigma factor
MKSRSPQRNFSERRICWLGSDHARETLSEREAAIIEPRFGLNGSTAKTLQQVSELIGLTRERVRQLEIEAIAKLRRTFNSHLAPVSSQVPSAS